MTNTNRAERGRQACKAGGDFTWGSVPMRSHIAQTLANILHFAESVGLDVEKVTVDARLLWASERD